MEVCSSKLSVEVGRLSRCVDATSVDWLDDCSKGSLHSSLSHGMMLVLHALESSWGEMIRCKPSDVWSKVSCILPSNSVSDCKHAPFGAFSKKACMKGLWCWEASLLSLARHPLPVAQTKEIAARLLSPKRPRGGSLHRLRRSSWDIWAWCEISGLQKSKKNTKWHLEEISEQSKPPWGSPRRRLWMSTSLSKISCSLTYVR